MIDRAFARSAPALLAERWGHLLEPDERFEASARRGDDGTTVTLVVVGPGGEFRAEFEVTSARSGDEAFDLALDAADAVLAEWLEAERPRLTGVPEQREHQGAALLVTARLSRPLLEEHADALLDDRAS